MPRNRVILHCDLNSFYASCEQCYRPELRGSAVAVGGDVEMRHGIILAASKEAKDFGVKTGNTIREALRKCPKMVVLPPNYSMYLKFSNAFREILGSYSDQVEAFGLDEGWVDVGGSTHLFGDGEHIAGEIRRRAKDELGITASVGVSYNKIFAKLGSDMKKPDATTVIPAQNFQQVVWPLPAGDLLYVGPATQKKLAGRGLYTIGDLAKYPVDSLKSWLGKMGVVLWRFANGLDDEPVSKTGSLAPIKSIGNSTTTPQDLKTDTAVKRTIYLLAESVAARLRDHGFRGCVVQISIRDNTLLSFERQMKLKRPTQLAMEIVAASMALFHANYDWHRNKPIRSMGVRVSKLEPTHGYAQLTLFGDENQSAKQEQMEHTVDDIRRRFGFMSIQRGILLEDRVLAEINPKDNHIIHPVGFFKPS